MPKPKSPEKPFNHPDTIAAPNHRKQHQPALEKTMTMPSNLISNSTFTRYLVVVPMMDAVAPVLGAEPTAYTGTVDAASREVAQILAEMFALDLAKDRSAWTDEAEDLPFADAQEALSANGLYIGDPIVEPLADVSHVAGARLGS